MTGCREYAQVLDIRETGICPSGTEAFMYHDSTSMKFMLLCKCMHHTDAGVP